MKTNMKYGNREPKKTERHKHIAGIRRHDFTNENLTDKAIMFIHSGLDSQTMHCIVEINPSCPSLAATML